MSSRQQDCDSELHLVGEDESVQYFPRGHAWYYRDNLLVEALCLDHGYVTVEALDVRQIQPELGDVPILSGSSTGIVRKARGLREKAVSSALVRDVSTDGRTAPYVAGGEVS